MSDIIELNVGGESYSTRLATITRYPDSMLGRMFTGQLPTTKDKNGRFFIDRDGKLFRYILNYLRTSSLTLPENFKEYDALCIEAEFYQIDLLVNALPFHKPCELKPAQDHDEILEMLERMTPKSKRDMFLLHVTVLVNQNQCGCLSGRQEVLNGIPSRFFQAKDDDIARVASYDRPADHHIFDVRVIGAGIRCTYHDMRVWRKDLTEFLLRRECSLVTSNTTDNEIQDFWLCDLSLLY